jgi:uncharacterized membrane protein YbhN (UPF0104 family)
VPSPPATTPPSSSNRRRGLTWLASLLGGAALLWLASRRLQLWPDELNIVAPALLWAALAIHVPYAFVRAVRLSWLLDPIVARQTGRADARFSRALVHGSGYVSFFVLLVLPLKLGELSRPLLLARGHQPGVGLPEALSAVATERVVDGLIICGMLFVGLALAPVSASASALADVQRIGQLMALVFAIGLVVLWIAGRDPAAAGRLAARLPGVVGRRGGPVVERFAAAMAGLRQPALAIRLVGWSLVYWAITTAQLWLVMRASGIEIPAAAAAATVAIVGLSIQLPGGPAQVGTFQVGAALALGLFLDEATLAGPGSTFAAVMYVLQFVAAGLCALPGLWLLRAPPGASAAEVGQA